MQFPSDQAIRQAVKALHNAPHLVYIYQTGVTGGLCQWLWTPGASRTIMGFNFIYPQESQDEVLGHTPDNYCSELNALQLAAAAREEATRLAHKRKLSTHPVIGIGITGAVSTDRVRRGEDRVHLAAATSQGMHVFTVVFLKPVVEEAPLVEDEEART